MTGPWIRARARELAVWGIEAFPLGPLLRARQRFDRSQIAANATPRAPRALRLSRRRPIPPETRSFAPPGRPDLRFVNADSYETQLVYWLGLSASCPACGGIALWESLCSRSESIVEIGANVGFYTIPGALAAHGRYRAVEPHPVSAGVLRSNLAENGLERVEVIEAAVVPDEWRQQVRLAAPPGREWGTPAGARIALAGEQGTAVRSIPVSAAIGDRDLVKIDVEGLEAELLRHSLHALRRTRPLLMVEIHDNNAELRALLPELLASLDARAYNMRQTTLLPVESATLRNGPLYAIHRAWDYLLVPSIRSERVDDLIDRATPAA